MKALNKNKGMLGAVAIFLLLIWFYNLFFKPDTSALPPALPPSIIGNELLKLHQQLKVVTLDQAILSLPSYILLADFTIEIPEQPVGRINPFNLIGRD